jgi:hypothetical protein
MVTRRNSSDGSKVQFQEKSNHENTESIFRHNKVEKDAKFEITRTNQKSNGNHSPSFSE